MLSCNRTGQSLDRASIGPTGPRKYQALAAYFICPECNEGPRRISDSQTPDYYAGFRRLLLHKAVADLAAGPPRGLFHSMEPILVKAAGGRQMGEGNACHTTIIRSLCQTSHPRSGSGVEQNGGGGQLFWCPAAWTKCKNQRTRHFRTLNGACKDPVTLGFCGVMVLMC